MGQQAKRAVAGIQLLMTEKNKLTNQPADLVFVDINACRLRVGFYCKARWGGVSL